ncbi:hypothetical protein [Holdemania filiformis]|uniref:hypothetical protein n=1 Tax=Holdemania filiformis TaxID=61171 RepID=UPI00210D8A92|nr:hypothetical protein [Holdemania filiformis]MCQ4954418.1 hypothetical protein [Holdemania filiformis]
MVEISIVISLILIFDSYLLGKCISKYFNWNADYFPIITIGFFVILGIFEFFVFAFVKFQFSVYYILFVQYILLIIPIFVAIKVKVNLIPTQKELKMILGGALFTIIFAFLMGNQTLGEAAFDSNFYLSMVIENSTSPTLGTINGYTGNIENISTLHGYQGFYYFHSLLLKNIRNILSLNNTSLTPVYLWTSALTYFYMLSDILFHSINLFLEKKSLHTKIVALLFVLVFFTNYFNISFPFYGNTWKTLNIACNMLILYEFIKLNNNKSLFLLTFLNSSLIGFSSSGFFIACFIEISFFFYLIWKKEQNYTVYLEYWISCLSLLIFALLYFSGNNIKISILILAIYCLAGYTVYLTKRFDAISWKKMLQLFKFIFIISVLLLVIVSYFVRNSMFSGSDSQFNGYSFFFRLNSLGDMTLNYFIPVNKIELVRNCVFWFIIFINCFQEKYEKEYKFFLLLIIILFVNPFVTPFVVKYMTSIVYSRCFEIFINPFCLLIFYTGLIEWLEKNKNIEILFLLTLEIGSIGIIVHNNISYYSKFFIPQEGYNPVYRVTNDQWELYQNLIEELQSSKLERPLILNQDIAVKAYVSNIRVLIDANTSRSAPAYSDEDIDAPSDWLNIFYVRDYYGQHIWKQDPDYSKICDAIIDSNCDYVIMDKEVVVLKGDLYLPLWFDARGCCDVIFDNDKFVLLKVRK